MIANIVAAYVAAEKTIKQQLKKKNTTTGNKQGEIKFHPKKNKKVDQIKNQNFFNDIK